MCVPLPRYVALLMTVIGTLHLHAARADGYTLGYANMVYLAIFPSLMAKLPYDIDREIQVVGRFTSGQNLLAVRTTLPVKPVAELVTHARQSRQAHTHQIRSRRGIIRHGDSGLCAGRGSLQCRFQIRRRFNIMSISFSDVGENLRKIVITGRLDIPGTDSVAAKLEALTAEPKKAVVVDLSSLRFLASIGIRSLIVCAKAVQQRGGKMVLVVGDNSSVTMSLEATGIDELLPTFKSAAEAERAALA